VELQLIKLVLKGKKITFRISSTNMMCLFFSFDQIYNNFSLDFG